MTWLQILQGLCAFVVLAEALNKLERADLFGGQRGWRPRLLGLVRVFLFWRWKRPMVVLVLKVWGWALLSIGAGGALASLLLHDPIARAQAEATSNIFTLAGFCLLIVRSRLKEIAP